MQDYKAALEPARKRLESLESFVILFSTPNLEEASMWMAANRKSYERKGLRYPSDMSDAEWVLVKPLVDVPQHGQGPRRQVDLREVLNAVFYILETGCQG